MAAKRVVALALALALGGTAWAADNPLLKAKVGDWMLMKTTMTDGPMAGMEMATTKIILAAKDDKQATTVIVTEAMGQKQRFKQVVNLDEEFDPITMMGQAQAQGAKKTGEGEETIKVLGKDYKCSWVSFSLDDPNGQAMGDMKIWLTPDLLLGFAKMDLVIKQGPMTMTLESVITETGAGEKVADLDKIPDVPKPPAAQ